MPKKKSSSVWEAALLNFVSPLPLPENETLGPVYLGCEGSSSSVSLSMLKVSSLKTRDNLCT